MIRLAAPLLAAASLLVACSTPDPTPQADAAPPWTLDVCISASSTPDDDACTRRTLDAPGAS